ncbi:MAG: hypothetical protein IJ752_05400 [Alphaproteobacteria bacterium]|nr:hypothetical protein [Alphaproteobacteria bacterium]
MPDQDKKILMLILKKESDYSQEICRLANSLSSQELLNELSDYRSGLCDLKNDFLYPAANKLSEKNEPAALVSADRHWYYRHT